MEIINKGINESVVNLILAIDSLPKLSRQRRNNLLAISELSSRILIAGLEKTSLEDKVNFIKLSTLFLNKALVAKEEEKLSTEEIDYIKHVSKN